MNKNEIREACHKLDLYLIRRYKKTSGVTVKQIAEDNGISAQPLRNDIDDCKKKGELLPTRTRDLLLGALIKAEEA